MPTSSSSTGSASRFKTYPLSRWPITRPNGLPPLYVDLSHLPRSSLFSDETLDNAAKSVGRCVQITSDAAAKEVGRPYTQEEAEAVAFSLGKAGSVLYNSMPAALMAVLGLSWRGRRTFRFPFHTPKWTRRSPDRFFSLRGRTARGYWHALRASAYSLTAGPATVALLFVYAGTVAGISQYSDPRMQDYFALVKQQRGHAQHDEKLTRTDQDRIAEGHDHETLEPTEERGWTGLGDEGDEARTTERWDVTPPTESSSTEDYHDQHQPTDKKALLEAIRRTDGKSGEGGNGDPWDSFQESPDISSSPPASTPERHVTDSPSSAESVSPSESAWDRLRKEAGKKDPQSVEQGSWER